MATTTGGDVVETTTRSSRDDGTGGDAPGERQRGPSRDSQRHAQTRVTPHVPPNVTPDPSHVAPEPRYPKCSPRAALPQMLPQSLKCCPRAALTPNVPPEPLYPKMLPQMLRYTLVALMSPRAALPQMLPRSRVANVVPEPNHGVETTATARTVAAH